MWCCRLRSASGFGVGFLVWVRFELKEDLVLEVRGHRCRVGGVPDVLPGCLGRLCRGRGASGSLACGCSFALAVALWMRSAGRGASEHEVEDVDEDDGEEEAVVSGDTGCAVMRAVAGWRVAAASAAATAGRMEGRSLGHRFGVGGWGGPAVTWRPGRPIWSAAVGEGGAGLWSSPSGLGWGGVLQCVRLCGLASAGGNSLRGLLPGAGGSGPGVPGVCAVGVCGSLGRMDVPWGVGLLAVGVCGMPGVGHGEVCLAGGSVAGVCCCLCGWGRPVSRSAGLRAMVGVCGLPGWKQGGKDRGRDRAGGVLCRCMCPLAAARQCGNL